MKSGRLSVAEKEDLRLLYESLNPTELRRKIDRRLAELQKVHDRKTRQRKEVNPKLTAGVFGVMINHSTDDATVS